MPSRGDRCDPYSTLSAARGRDYENLNQITRFRSTLEASIRIQRLARVWLAAATSKQPVRARGLLTASLSRAAHVCNLDPCGARVPSMTPQ